MAEGRVIDHASVQMGASDLGARQFEAVGAAHDPAMHHRERQFTVKLDAPGIGAVAAGRLLVLMAGR